jgi:hypothetical protein
MEKEGSRMEKEGSRLEKEGIRRGGLVVRCDDDKEMSDFVVVGSAINGRCSREFVLPSYRGVNLGREVRKMGNDT